MGENTVDIGLRRPEVVAIATVLEAVRGDGGQKIADMATAVAVLAWQEGLTEESTQHLMQEAVSMAFKVLHGLEGAA